MEKKKRVKENIASTQALLVPQQANHLSAATMSLLPPNPLLIMRIEFREVTMPINSTN
jgi:hypothetical protein